MRKKNVINENYLEKKPLINPNINWNTDENGIVTLEIENKGVANRIAQFLIKKPKISYIHLDEMGSFIWPLIDGERTVTDISVFVSEHFGEKANPLYERLTKFFSILESYNFVKINK